MLGVVCPTRQPAGSKLRGYSALVQEAVDLLLQRRRDDDLDAVLALEGILSDEEADALEASRVEIRNETWRTFS